MTDLIRSAKFGRDWTLSDLDAYNIRLVSQEAAQFFDIDVLSDPSVDSELLENLEANAMQQDRNAVLVTLLDLAMTQRGETGVVDFTVELFRILGYAHRNRVACRRRDLGFLVCGKRRHVDTDICILDRG